MYKISIRTNRTNYTVSALRKKLSREVDQELLDTYTQTYIERLLKQHLQSKKMRKI